MIKKILGVIAVLIAVLLIAVAMQPPTFNISRSATLPAPPDRVFAQVGKAVSLVMNCDKMVGPQFEKGLENMRAAVQAAP